MHLIAISVGNTRTRMGVFRDESLDYSEAIENSDPAAVAGAIQRLPLDRPDAPVFLASVNNPVADRLVALLGPRFGDRLHRFGPGLPVPVEAAVRDPGAVGQDRLLNAAGAFDRAKEACIVIDAGTAVTVDFVDGQGVFQGGAIAPGLNMTLRALHEQTAALPAIRYRDPFAAPPPAETETGGPGQGPSGPAPFGKDTESAMLLGARAAVVGLVHYLIDRYAEYYGAYPCIIATGGDAQTLFAEDDIVEHVVPDLTLLGVHAACRRLVSDD
jgi:type III pantothenate kinase